MMILAGSALVANAQVKFGVEGGITFTNPKTTTPISEIAWTPGIGIRLGGFAQYGFHENFSVRGGLVFEQKKFTNEFKVTDMMGNSGTMYHKYTLSYITIPVRVFYGLKINKGSLLFGLGPDFSIGAAAKVKATNTNDKLPAVAPSFGFGSDANEIKAFDPGFGITLGYEFANGIGANINVVYGLSNLFNNTNNSEWFNRNSGIGVYYIFNK